MSLKMFGKRTDTIDEVTEFVPGRRIAHRTLEGALRLNTACLTATEGGGTRTTVIAEADRLPGGKWGRLLEPLIARFMRRGFRSDLRRLKKILESDAADIQPARRAG
jgi:uncharacterized membrane protein